MVSGCMALAGEGRAERFFFVRQTEDGKFLVNPGFRFSLPARSALRVDNCAVSSVVEHLPDTEGVTGSNPVSRTIKRQ